MSVIQLDQISKVFPRGGRIRRPLYREWARLRRDKRPADSPPALSQVSLDIPQGARVGIVGPNGAGKSTLLRVVAGIVQPSSGQCRVSGRVACALSVGAGFVHRLSVRDNVRLAAAIFAVPLQKIDFASILALAELEGREETVLEALSWGTQSRLFAAVVLEAMARDAADVFLFDEWLTGVDRSFGKRIVNRLSQLSSNSQTVLLASHDLEFLEQVCDRCILLDGGKFVRSASASEIIAAYRKRSDSA